MYRIKAEVPTSRGNLFKRTPSKLINDRIVLVMNRRRPDVFHEYETYLKLLCPATETLRLKCARIVRKLLRRDGAAARRFVRPIFNTPNVSETSETLWGNFT